MKDVAEMTTRELRKEIRQVTAQVNVDIAEYREKGKRVQSTEEMIERAQKIAGTKSRRGAIGLGLSRKLKGALQQQLAGLRRLAKIFTEPKKEKVEKGYITFKRRFGDISRVEYEDFIDTINIIKSDLEGWGYEDFGGSVAQAYADANEKGKRNFIDYMREATAKSAGGTPEDIIDNLKDIMTDDEAI